MLPVIKLSMRYAGGQPVIMGACKASVALLELMGRQTLKTSELNHLNRMGFQIEFTGDLKAVFENVGKKNLDGHVVKKEFFS